ncbi:MAG: hypothetical protein IJ689_03155 [Alphaproteobacteria bacterium]|nr:hypothetical protein [Alphaproteobacteria bacterium]
MTNKTFLILLLAGVSYTAYNAAAVSENFAISTTIDHEIVLGNLRTASADANITKTGDINIGTIVINPASERFGQVNYSPNGTVTEIFGPVISATSASPGTFTADIPNPEGCMILERNSCHGITVTQFMPGLLGSKNSWCNFFFIYTGSDNIFKIYPRDCYFKTPSDTTAGPHSGTLTISYTQS